MHAPDPGKWSVALDTVSLLAVLAAGNGDRVGCAAATDSVEFAMPPRQGDRHVQTMLGELFRVRQNRAALEMTAAFRLVAQMVRTPSSIVIVSDCIDTHEAVPGWLVRIRALRRHSVTVVVVSSPMEWQLPDAGLLRVEDAETGHARWIDTHDPAVRQAFARRAAHRRREVLQEIRRAGASAVELRCDRDVIPQLSSLVQVRSRR
jgi:uncharacterized protein (DUF58 family)